MLGKAIISAGLIMNMVGAGLLAWDIILTKTDELELSRHYFPEPDERSHESRKLLQVKRRVCAYRARPRSAWR